MKGDMHRVSQGMISLVLRSPGRFQCPAGVGGYHATWAITPHVSVMVDFSNNIMSNHGLAFLFVDVIIPVM